MNHSPRDQADHVASRPASGDDGNAIHTERARSRALRTARAVTLGLAIAVTAAGCDAVTNAWCHVFEGTRTCCDRASGRYWDTSTNRCEYAAPVEGPIVPPDLPRAARPEAA